MARMTAAPCAVCCFMVRAWCTVLGGAYLRVVGQVFAKQNIMTHALPICMHAAEVTMHMRLQHLPCSERVRTMPYTCCVCRQTKVRPYVCACH